MILVILPYFLGRLGMAEILVILLIVVLLFGAKKVPELMRGMGRGVKEFKDAMNKDYSEGPRDKDEEEKKE